MTDDGAIEIQNTSLKYFKTGLLNLSLQREVFRTYLIQSLYKEFVRFPRLAMLFIEMYI